MIFDENQLEQILYNCRYVDEVFVNLRKGKAQTRYIIEVERGSTYFNTKSYNLDAVDKELLGFWMQEFETDNSWDGYIEALRNNNGWVKCKPVEVKTIKWEKTDETI